MRYSLAVLMLTIFLINGLLMISDDHLFVARVEIVMAILGTIILFVWWLKHPQAKMRG
jgi:hypothetical protein